MFNFIKKAGTVTSDKDEKEKRKRDKKDRKDKQKRERASMSAEELLRLDEVCIFVLVTKFFHYYYYYYWRLHVRC